jgi:hypothetical protein
LTATELVRRIRGYAQELAEGLPYGECATYAGTVRVRVPDGHSDLLHAVRDWLATQARRGKLEAHNFGRGHCSGMRFRPVGEGLTKAETKTIESERREKPVHFSDPQSKGNWYAPLCSRKARETIASKQRGYRFFRPHAHKYVRTTDKLADVTCKRCKTLVDDGALLDSNQKGE